MHHNELLWGPEVTFLDTLPSCTNVQPVHCHQQEQTIGPECHCLVRRETTTLSEQRHWVWWSEHLNNSEIHEHEWGKESVELGLIRLSQRDNNKSESWRKENLYHKERWNETKTRWQTFCSPTLFLHNYLKQSAPLSLILSIFPILSLTQNINDKGENSELGKRKSGRKNFTTVRGDEEITSHHCYCFLVKRDHSGEDKPKAKLNSPPPMHALAQVTAEETSNLTWILNQDQQTII